MTVTDNGSTGTTITLGTSTSTGTNTGTPTAPTAPTTTTVQLPGSTVQVSGTSGSQLTVVQTPVGSGSGTQSTLSVTGGTSTFTATTSQQPLGDVGGLILVSANQSGASATLTGSSGSTPPNVVTGGNTTVTIIGTPAQVNGATLQLPSSSSSAPVSFQSSPSATPVEMTPGTRGAQFTVQAVSQNDGSSVSALVITAGSVTLTVPGGSSTGIATGNGTVTAGNASTTMTITASAGQQILFVGSGFVILPTPNANANRSSRGGSEILPGGKLYAGESATLDAAGKVTAAWVGSTTGDQAIAGDPLPDPGIGGLSLRPKLPRLNGSSQRLKTDLISIPETALAAFNLTRTHAADKLGAYGIGNGTASYQGMPVGRVTIDQRLENDTTVVGNGKVLFTQNGIRITYVPASTNLEALSALIVAQGGKVVLYEDGVLLIHQNDQYQAVQPGYDVTTTGASEALVDDPAGGKTYTDPQGKQQRLYPALIDFTTLEKEVKKLDATATLLGKANGTLTLTLSGQTFTLLPDMNLQRIDPARINQSWWIGDDGKVYVRVGNVFLGWVQSFSVR